MLHSVSLASGFRRLRTGRMNVATLQSVPLECESGQQVEGSKERLAQIPPYIVSDDVSCAMTHNLTFRCRRERSKRKIK